MSIMSFPNRGHWGKSNWRGNCSGFVYKELFERLKPSFFVDPMVGSGTSIEVAKELNIKAVGLDLHLGFNALKMSILEALDGNQADLVLSHPPYHDLLKYSGHVWGNKEVPDDLSHCTSVDDFNEKMHAVLLNQREATRSNGIYGCIIGDQRKNGEYRSYQAELIARMPSSELASVIIKAQHNTRSETNQYGNMRGLPFILHEYILLWRKPNVIHSWLGTLHLLREQERTRYSSTWKSIVRCALMTFGDNPANLDAIYAVVERNADERLKGNSNFKAKVRQILNQNRELFTSVDRGVWKLAA